jgi:hypothetical protein
MATPKKGKGGTRPQHDNPIRVLGVVDELPPRQYSSVANELLEQIVEADGKIVELDPAGRKASSVQSMIDSAAKRHKLEITVAVRGDRVFANLEKGKKK